eukprot:CAMPEP_0114984496 /NCGR_PEP_ID=MMETSP0216-20121206/7307_1 /TAXON_ID=223996 /ORGANISM="Protocruzia adherens, Strain Boccale" /LENGTH=335 /DNA_ID=CAMNT_0002346635 /DNA_START=27 /DNA_END=1034 /DNA_ORIENTATION=-
MDSSSTASKVPENANTDCPGTDSDQAGKSSACAGCPNQNVCASGEANKPDPTVDDIAVKLQTIDHKLLVLSGKGGVGKSTFSSQLALALAFDSQQSEEVGLLDVDICGPSIPRMLAIENQEVHQSSEGWSPVYVEDNLAVMSIGFLLGDRNNAVIWRGPKKNGLIKQFFLDVSWGNLDYLVVDTPPGTSDEHISIAQYLKNCEGLAAVLVTTPQEVSLLDVRKEISFCLKTGIKILGVVENMSGFVCPNCSHESHIFPGHTGGAEGMCKEFNIPFLGSIPLDPNLLLACDSGKSFIKEFAGSKTAEALKQIVTKIKTILKEQSSSKETSQAMERD